MKQAVSFVAMQQCSCERVCRFLSARLAVSRTACGISHTTGIVLCAILVARIYTVLTT